MIKYISSQCILNPLLGSTWSESKGQTINLYKTLLENWLFYVCDSNQSPWSLCPLGIHQSRASSYLSCYWEVWKLNFQVELYLLRQWNPQIILAYCSIYSQIILPPIEHTNYIELFEPCSSQLGIEEGNQILSLSRTSVSANLASTASFSPSPRAQLHTSWIPTKNLRPVNPLRTHNIYSLYPLNSNFDIKKMPLHFILSSLTSSNYLHSPLWFYLTYALYLVPSTRV